MNLIIYKKLFLSTMRCDFYLFDTHIEVVAMLL
jgi:hypothetical protein